MKLPWKSILRQIKSKRDSETTLVFNISKTYQKEILNWLQFFAYKITWKCGVTSVFHLNCTKKYAKITLIFRPSKSGQYMRRQNFAHRSYAEQSTSKNVDFLLIKIASKKVRRIDGDFSHIEISTKKLRQNQNNVEIHWYVLFNVSAKYRHQIRRWFDMACPLCRHPD